MAGGGGGGGAEEVILGGNRGRDHVKSRPKKGCLGEEATEGYG